MAHGVVTSFTYFPTKLFDHKSSSHRAVTLKLNSSIVNVFFNNTNLSRFLRASEPKAHITYNTGYNKTSAKLLKIDYIYGLA